MSLGSHEREDARRSSSKSSSPGGLVGDSEICEQCGVLEDSQKVSCTFCGGTRCSDCKPGSMEYRIYDKMVCKECISKLYLETNNLLQEELDVKDQINLNLKRGLEEQFQVISKCKQFIIALEEIISLQGLWRSICEFESTESVQNLLFECQAGIQKWNQKNRILEMENSSLKSQIAQQNNSISILESHIHTLQEEYKQSKEAIESLKKIKFEKDNLRSIAHETSTLMEKFKLENDGLRVRCFRLEQRVKELTNNYGIETQHDEPNNYKHFDGRTRTISLGLQDNQLPPSILENSAVVFNNHQLLDCVERGILYIKNLLYC
ncbi:putative zinc finger and FYVE domain-containing protein [Cryptosporidium canis]|uniref:Zinc finger and FYVE domain-containing protein n=1 Tax=Cryptosporidium canis TaxID=195482 RepID=A0ABQ8P5P0_9CRYT|nr:putative zinc finger and FYVE domain-containing protein [Cryptosporidium canis]KAJ1612100.1 putative zinc finger and FYVE domain-containing protein [Cryptosporidium canis]